MTTSSRIQEDRKKLRRTAWADEHRIVFENSGEQVKASDMVIGTLVAARHQSTFDMTDGAKVIFGPAPRPLPQLQITADAAGNLMAKGDFSEPVGPSSWERR